jgi:4-carboxymuconolactone decarboxylase
VSPAKRRGLDTPVAILCRFAAAAAVQNAEAVSSALGEARRRRIAPRVLDEVALMLVPYAGFPAGLEALRTLRAKGPDAPRATREGGTVIWRRRGERLARRVYGPVYPRLERAVRALHPDLASWTIEFGYGRVLSRPGLAARERECVTVAVLAACGWRRQLVSHLLGAARLGASRAAIRRAFEIGVSVAAPSNSRRAHTALGEAFPEFDRTRSAP